MPRANLDEAYDYSSTRRVVEYYQRSCTESVETVIEADGLTSIDLTYEGESGIPKYDFPGFFTVEQMWVLGSSIEIEGYLNGRTIQICVAKEDT